MIRIRSSCLKGIRFTLAFGSMEEVDAEVARRCGCDVRWAGVRGGEDGVAGEFVVDVLVVVFWTAKIMRSSMSCTISVFQNKNKEKPSLDCHLQSDTSR